MQDSLKDVPERDESTNASMHDQPATASTDTPNHESTNSGLVTDRPTSKPMEPEAVEVQKSQERINSLIHDLAAHIDGIQDRMEHERAEREWHRQGLRSGGPSLTFPRPSMAEWDLYRPDAYTDQHTQDRYFDAIRHKVASNEFNTAGRKKVMMRLMEAELQWLKNEDKAFAEIIEGREAIKAENWRLSQQLAAAEERLQALEPDKPRSTTTGEGEEEDHHESDGEDHEVAGDIDVVLEAPKWPVSKVNRVEWAVFSSPYRLATERYAIDVLNGEPVINFEAYYRPSWKSRHMKKSPLQGKAPPSKKKQSHSGQEPLPERIRINSLHVIRILQRLDADNFAYVDEVYDHGSKASLVMIRPFKALIYLEDQIRQVHEELLARYHGSSSKLSQNEQGVRPEDAGNGDRPDEDQAREEGAGGSEDDESAATNPVEEVLKDKFTSSKVALEQLQTLIQFLDTDIKVKVNYVRSEQCQRVAFADVWYLFQPGDEVVDQGRKQAYRVIGITSSGHKAINPYDMLTRKTGSQVITLHCVYLDCDGEAIGPVLHDFDIPVFDGEKAITSLEIFPLRRAESRTESASTGPTFREKLIFRGKMFIDVLSGKHMQYSGLTLKNKDDVDGQVVVDFEKAFETDGKLRPSVLNLIGFENESTLETDCNAACCLREIIHKDELSQQPSVIIYPRPTDSRLAEHALTDEDYLIMSYRAFGFILRSRKWAELDLTHLSYIRGTSDGHDDKEDQSEMRETAFDQLVLEKGHKDMLLSLVAQHYRNKESPTAANEQVDIVRGKGKGLIILLHGAPGVGKTTTAEGVAEHFEKPLFQITCGDLGTTADSVEHSLETNFALASRWGCILLLDEADVFLAKRTPQDFIRNGLVSVFLRVLEYYAGILFLTTNRIGDFDEAFGSRIHISLHYPQLELDATQQIFMLNMKIIQHRFAYNNRKLVVDKASILQYVEAYWTKHKNMRWNGRQIRNACQTALALAEFEAGGGDHKKIIDPNAEVELRVAHFDTVSRAYLDFMKYLKKLYKADHDRLAQKRGYRARELDGKHTHLSDDDCDPLDREYGVSDPISGRKQSGFAPGLLSPASVANPSPNLKSPSPNPQLEALAAASQESNSGPASFIPTYLQSPQPQMATYHQGFPQGYPHGGQTQGLSGFGPAQQFGGVPASLPQQQAHMWQNINPAMWQQAMLQGQNSPFGAMPPGVPNQQPPHGGGAGTDSHKT